MKLPTVSLKAAGKALWAAVLDEFELSQGELALLSAACLAADVIAECSEVIEAEGITDGSFRPHWAVVERRQQTLLLGRVLAALRIPAGDEGEILDGPRPQRRS